MNNTLIYSFENEAKGAFYMAPQNLDPTPTNAPCVRSDLITNIYKIESLFQRMCFFKLQAKPGLHK